MKIIEIKKREPLLLEQLLKIWENSVKVTHLFLSEGEFKNIRNYVDEALKSIADLLAIENESKKLIGFMGVNKQKLEMLFIAPEEIGKGYRKKLLKYGIANYQINKLTVNEQNPRVKRFYEYMGFQTYKRTEKDQQGNPYPLLYMKLK